MRDEEEADQGKQIGHVYIRSLHFLLRIRVLNRSDMNNIKKKRITWAVESKMNCGRARVIVGKLVRRLQEQSKGEGVVAWLGWLY